MKIMGQVKGKDYIIVRAGQQVGGQTLEVQCHVSYMSAVVAEGAGRTSKDGNIAFEALQQFANSLTSRQARLRYLLYVT
jgi:hypothetical protein